MYIKGDLIDFLLGCDSVPDKYNYKAEFLAWKNQNKDLANLFTHCDLFELKVAKDIKVEKDICEFTVEEFTSLLKYLLDDRNLEISNVQKQVTYLRQYLDFCNGKANLPLKRQDIDKVISANGGVRKWLEDLTSPDDFDNLISFNDLVSLENIADRTIVTNQLLAFVWLLFIGLQIDEIRYIKENDINDWDKWYRKGMESPKDIKDKVSSILSLASKETSILRGSNSGRQRHLYYKKSDYFFKSTYKAGQPIPPATLSKYFGQIEKILGKKRLHQVNIRKSGMLYFGSLQLREYGTIKTFPEMNSLIYRPIRERFNEGKSCEIELRRLFANSAVTKFYGIEPITQLDRIPSLQNNNEEAAHDLTEQPLQRPEARNPDELTLWERNVQRGKTGESLVLSWIRDKGYDPEAIQVKDTAGYDIYAEIENEVYLIEVKTIGNISKDIHITKNEYKVAHSKRKYYWFYIVILEDGEKNNPVAYTFKDLLSLLGLQDKEQELFMHNSKYGIEYDSFSIHLDANVFEKCNQRIEL